MLLAQPWSLMIMWVRSPELSLHVHTPCAIDLGKLLCGAIHPRYCDCHGCPHGN